MPNINQHVQLVVREETAPSLSFCSAKPKAMQTWVDELRLTNIGKTSKQLYQAVSEVHTLKTTADTRLQLLEILRKPVRNICATLSRNYLGQPLILSAKTMNSAQLAQALQSELASAYGRVLIDTKDTRTGLTRKPPQHAITALFRCMDELLQIQLRCHLLYSSLPDQYWIRINTLYLIAEQLCCLSMQQPTSDYGDLSSITIADLYKTSILIEASKPEQLRQQELSLLTKVVSVWAQKVELTPYAPELTQSFSVNIHSNHPPQYHQTPKDHDLHEIRVLDTTNLVYTLRQFIQEHSTADAASSDQNFPVPDQFGPDLLNKLANAWGERSKRQLERTDTSQGIQACTGLTSIHYFASGCVDFASLIKSGNVTPFEEHEGGASNLGTSFSNTLTIESEDVWGKAFSAGFKEEPEEENKRHQRVEHTKTKEFKLETINASAGGYCLRWDPEVTEKIQAGDLIGLQPDSSKSWGLGVVRWIRQDQTGLFNIGVESISPIIRCCAIQAIGLTDVGAEPVRALLIPGSKKGGRPPTLVTPHRPFQAGSKAQLVLGKKTIQVRLKQSINSSYAYNQFTYMTLKENKRSGSSHAVETAPKKNDMESIYNNL